MHRILMPDGSIFAYQDKNENAEPTGDSIAKENSRKRLSISSASNNSIPQKSGLSTDSSKKDLPDTKFDLVDNDTAYMSAVESGDMEAAQRMVDKAAKLL